MSHLPPFVGRISMPRPILARTVSCALSSTALLSAVFLLPHGMLQAQAAPGRASSVDVSKLAEIHVAITAVNDSADARQAQAKNKTGEAQHELAAKKRQLITELLKSKGLSDTAYQRQRYVVSTDLGLRAQFDSVVAKLTGAPLPGRIVAPVAPGFVAASALPPGLVGTHIGHITTSFVDTPEKVGLLPIAFAEAQVASQHAALATRNTTDLAAMKLHAGHVLHAVDPTIVTTGPGKGFGVKRAALGVAQHIELASKEPTASPNVKIHTGHIATAARATASRADQVIALAKKIQETNDVKEAATLTGQLASLASQLAAGADVNADGRIDWGNGEGGLQQAQEHITLLLAGEKK
jgi:hypothetical protein